MREAPGSDPEDGRLFFYQRATGAFLAISIMSLLRASQRVRKLCRGGFKYFIYSRVRYQIFLQKQNKCPKVRFRKVPALFL